MHIVSTCNVLELRTPFRPLFWTLWSLWNAIGKPLPSALWHFCDFEGNPHTSETNWKVTAFLSAHFFYIFVNFTIWTKFFLITIWSRNALVWLCWVSFKKDIRSASMFWSIWSSSMALNKAQVEISTYFEVEDRFFRCFKKVTWTLSKSFETHPSRLAELWKTLYIPSKVSQDP